MTATAAVARAPTRSCSGFTRALRAAGVPVTHDRAPGFLEAVAAGRRSTTSGRPTGPAGRRCAPAPTTSIRYDQVFEAWFGARDSCPRRRRASRPRRDQRAACRRRGRPARPAARSTTGRRPGRGQRRRGAAAPRRRRRSTAARAAPARRDVRALRPAAADAAGAPRARRGSAARSTRTAPCATTLRRMGEPGRDRATADAATTAAAGGAAGRRVRLDERRTPTRCCGWRTGSSTPAPAAARRGVHARHPADPGHPGAAHARPRARARRAPARRCPDWSGGTRLGETLQAFLDRWGAAREWRAVRWSLCSATAGSAATPRCSASRWRGCSGSRTAWCG